MAEKDNYSEFIARKEDLHELNQLLNQKFARPEKERNYERIERLLREYADVTGISKVE